MAAAATRACASAVVGAPFGGVAIYSDGIRITGLRFVEGVPPAAADDDVAADAARQLRHYFVDPAFHFSFPLRVAGTPFQRRVWEAIAAIPCGSTRTYGDLARELDAPARAVGQACGDNSLPIVIPCHRIIGANGLGGFAHATGGFPPAVKRWLLEHEGALRGTLL